MRKYARSFYGRHIDAPKARICIEKTRSERSTTHIRGLKYFMYSHTGIYPRREKYYAKYVVARRKFFKPSFFFFFLTRALRDRLRCVVDLCIPGTITRLIVRYVIRRSEARGRQREREREKSPALYSHTRFLRMREHTRVPINKCVGAWMRDCGETRVEECCAPGEIIRDILAQHCEKKGLPRLW